MLAPSGSCYSVDAWLRQRFASTDRGRFWNWLFPEAKATVLANIATRLMQLHLCVIYLFGGISKARGRHGGTELQSGIPSAIMSISRWT